MKKLHREAIAKQSIKVKQSKSSQGLAFSGAGVSGLFEVKSRDF
jgi:hypothetical protein